MLWNLWRTFFPKKVSRQTIDLLLACFDEIKDNRFLNIGPQLRAELLRFEWESDDVFRNYVGFTYRPQISGRFEDPKGRWMRITGIRLKSPDGESSERMSIYVSRGLMCGYGYESNRKFKADPTSVDVSDVRVEVLDTPTEELKAIIPKDIQELINWADVFDVELDGKTYFHLKDIGDGDFLGIDESSNLYEIRHDPYEIRPLAGDLRTVFTKNN